jgi:hypothetical protein
MKHALAHLVLDGKPDDVLAALLKATLALRATSNGKRRMGSKNADGQRYDAQCSQIRREIKRRKREARMQDVAA